MSFELEDGVAIPPAHGGRQAVEYPFSAMAIGQSFFVAGGKRSTLAARAKTFAKHQLPLWKFKVADFEKDGVGGVRIWRVA